MARLPNTDFWRQLETHGRKLFPTHWRRRFEDLIGIERGWLRRAVDRNDLVEAQRVTVERAISESLHRRADKLRVQADAAARAANDFDYACTDRRSRVEAARFASEQDYVETFIADYSARHGLTFRGPGDTTVDYHGNPINQEAA